MDDTQKYLNQILKKRLGSIPNYNNSKVAGTVNRIPKQQQKIQTMPTVFRKKHQTQYIPNGTNGSYYSQAQNQFLSMKSGNQKSNQQNTNQMPQQTKKTSNQRVQYMLISKRLQNKAQDQFISPTVDVTKYSKIYAQQQKNMQLKKHKSSEFNTNYQKYSEQESYPNNNKISPEYASLKPVTNNQRVQNKSNLYENDAFGTKLSSNTDKSKRRKIF